MYERFFHLSSKPFALNPDPSFLYLSAKHAGALTMLEYGIESQAGFCLLTGEIGSGKTTVVRQLIRSLNERFTVGLVSNTHERFASIVPWALSALSLPSAPTDIAQYEALTDFVIREYGKGRRTLLIFDEAQNLSMQVLEELRLLSNLNSEQDIALQVLLVGQPELRLKLEKPELLQFAQRVAVDFHLGCLSLAEARAYVVHRLKVAGGDPAVFHPEAVAFIHARSRGVPRLINQLCDLALVYAFAEQRRSIDEHLVSQVLRERNRGRSVQLFSRDPAEEPQRAAEPQRKSSIEPSLTSKLV
jgi:type II secretory pathway predicted ATPase ExeA